MFFPNIFDLQLLESEDVDPHTCRHHRPRDPTDTQSSILILAYSSILWGPNRQSLPPSIPFFSSTYCHSCPWAVDLRRSCHDHCFPKPYQIWVLLSSIFLCKQLLSIGFIYCNLSYFPRLLLPNTPTHHSTHPQQKHTEKAWKGWENGNKGGRCWKEVVLNTSGTRLRLTEKHRRWSCVSWGVIYFVCSRILLLGSSTYARL